MPSNYEVGQACGLLSKVAQNHDISYSMAGKLQLSKTGWLVLDVPADLVRGAFNTLHEPGLELPPDYAIPVMSPAEMTSLGGPDKITERGHTFNFTTGPVRSHSPGREISKAFYIQIFSQDLKKLRFSYGLSPYMKGGHSFRLPIAMRKTGVVVEGDATKVSEYLEEPDWDEYDMEKVAAAVCF